MVVLRPTAWCSDQVIFGDVTLSDIVVFIVTIVLTILVAHLAYALIRRTLQDRVSLGILGIALAFASQQIVQNAFAGILFTITKPMQLEDRVEMEGMPITSQCRFVVRGPGIS